MEDRYDQRMDKKTIREQLHQAAMMNPLGSKEVLIQTAESLWPVVKDHRENDHDILDAVAARTARRLSQADIDPYKAVLLETLLGSMDGRLTLIGLTRWAEAGYPCVQMGHKYAAALIATNCSASVLEDVRAPWNGFVIEVPNGLLQVVDEDGLKEVRRILVTNNPNFRGDREWSFIAFTESSISLWRFGMSTEELLPPAPPEDIRYTIMSVDVEDRDLRTMSLIGHLIVSTCLAMSDPSQVKEIGPGHKVHASASKSGTRAPEPVCRTFQVGKPINLDLREQLRAYSEGKRGTVPTVQVMVAGHWKTQHYGPGNQQIKTIWIAPHFRGDEDAPIALRNHILRDI